MSKTSFLTTFICLATCLSLISACGSSGSSGGDSGSPNTTKNTPSTPTPTPAPTPNPALTYSIPDSSCKAGTTGIQYSIDINDLCKHLANHKANNFCGEQDREDMFQQRCAGTNIEWKEQARSYTLHTDRSRGCYRRSFDFNNEDEYCNALKNNELNKNCALEERKELFKQNCSGYTWDAVSSTGTITNNGSYRRLFNASTDTCTTNWNYSSKEDYCKKIKDDSLNSNCATNARQYLYATNCESKMGYHYVSFKQDGTKCELFKTFSTKDELCTALKNDSTNDNCANTERAMDYRHYCEQTTQQTFRPPFMR